MPKIAEIGNCHQAAKLMQRSGRRSALHRKNDARHFGLVLWRPLCLVGIEAVVEILRKLLTCFSRSHIPSAVGTESRKSTRLANQSNGG